MDIDALPREVLRAHVFSACTPVRLVALALTNHAWYDAVHAYLADMWTATADSQTWRHTTHNRRQVFQPYPGVPLRYFVTSLYRGKNRTQWQSMGYTESLLYDMSMSLLPYVQTESTTMRYDEKFYFNALRVTNKELSDDDVKRILDTLWRKKVYPVYIKKLHVAVIVTGRVGLVDNVHDPFLTTHDEVCTAALASNSSAMIKHVLAKIESAVGVPTSINYKHYVTLSYYPTLLEICFFPARRTIAQRMDTFYQAGGNHACKMFLTLSTLKLALAAFFTPEELTQNDVRLQILKTHAVYLTTRRDEDINAYEIAHHTNDVLWWIVQVKKWIRDIPELYIYPPFMIARIKADYKWVPEATLKQS